MHKIVLTGGPSSGKTTLSKEFCELYSNKVHVCKEAAEMLFRGGFPRQDTPSGIEEQQYAIFHLQRALERLAPIQSHDAEIIIFDRGLLDGLCYWKASKDTFAKKMNIDLSEIITEYDLVIQLGVAHAEDYQNTSFRPEDQETSMRMESDLKKIWGSHPNYHFISYDHDWQTKKQKCLALVEDLRQNRLL